MAKKTKKHNFVMGGAVTREHLEHKMAISRASKMSRPKNARAAKQSGRLDGTKKQTRHREIRSGW